MIEVFFEVTIDKNIKTGLPVDQEINSPGLLHGRKFKGSLKYDPSNLSGMGGDNLYINNLNNRKSGLLSVAFEFINFDTGTGKKIYTEKDNRKDNGSTPVLLFNNKTFRSLFLFVGDIYVELSPTEDIPSRGKSANKAGFIIYSNFWFVNDKGESPTYLTFFAKNGSLSGHGRVNYFI